MIQTTELARGVYKIAMFEEPDMIQAGICFPGASYNMFLVHGARPAIIQTMFRRSFERFRDAVARLVDPAKLAYIVVPHHEGDSSGAMNQWLETAPHATVLCSELCAVQSFRDIAIREPRVVKDGEVADVGPHRLRFLSTPSVDYAGSLMTFEETTGVLFPNDLFSTFGTDAVTDADRSKNALGTARKLGYQPDDRTHLGQALDRISALPVKVVASMHGPATTAHFDRLVKTMRENSLVG